jgi:hypothetical protein
MNVFSPSTYDSSFDDYFITSIGGVTQTSTQFWGLLYDLQFAPVGGCQLQVAPGHEILWAFDAFNKSHFLKLAGAPAQANVGIPVTVTVTAENGSAISGATVTDGTTTATSDSNGQAILTFITAGTKVIKASRTDSIRSNAQTITVTA